MRSTSSSSIPTPLKSLAIFSCFPSSKFLEIETSSPRSCNQYVVIEATGGVARNVVSTVGHRRVGGVTSFWKNNGLDLHFSNGIRVNSTVEVNKYLLCKTVQCYVLLFEGGSGERTERGV